MDRLMAKTLYRQVDVWKRGPEGEVYCYRCFETIPDGRYCVQSRDTYRKTSLKSRLPEMSTQHTELFIEEAPDIRSRTHGTLQEAIADFDREFGNDG
jgi:hypothetical protein